ncbi:Variant-specific surface protein [Giardia duodenalis]|uniref:Variant-specific surface protein n=1 Tax=Giardia intestinalis TaxID=5741 RepID=V6TR45_GIAIN|nr:Variant-specific surface protein [Giardia intestinalis]
MSGKFLLIGLALQLARAVQVAGGGYENGSFSATDRNSKSMNSEHNNADNCNIKDCLRCSSETIPGTEEVRTICAECKGNKKLSPLKDACLDACPAGTYETTATADRSKVCVFCHTSCAECNSDTEPTSCTACYPGYVLNIPDGPVGACIPQCTEGFGANCEPGACTANIAGSKYCSKCKTGFAPVDGMCVSMTQRTNPWCTPGEGVCAACAENYFLLFDGCYNSRTFPGNTVCTQATSGKCTQCASGQTRGNGSCLSCPVGCSKCNGGENSQTCSECLPGYYLSGSSCIECDKSNNSIQGVANCVSCIPPPDGSTGSVTCYVKIDRGDDTKKSAFPAGAIAGISVAAVVVIGGLVGFLCWWFLCKTKRTGVSSSTTALTRPTSS